jgi:hypothetical protein
VELASQHRLNQLLFKAEQSLRQLEVGDRVSAKPAIEAPEEVADVVSAIQAMRQLAGVGG